MDDALVEAVASAVNNIFNDMLEMAPVPSGAHEETGALEHSDVTGIIGIAGWVTGTISFHCQAELATRIAGTFLGMDVAEVNDDVMDVVGEMANMIAGGANTLLSQQGKHFEISLPTVITGSSYNVWLMGARHPWTSINFAVDGLLFGVGLCVKETSKVEAKDLMPDVQQA